MASPTTRRALLRAVTIAPVALAAPGLATTVTLPRTGGDIERHWQDRCAAYRAFNADDATYTDPDREWAYWDRIDAAEAGILNSPENGARAAEVKLWVAWSHYPNTGDRDPDIAQGNVPALRAVRDDMDWHEKLIFAAILNLRGEG